MRFTQVGHQVPRRNSKSTDPFLSEAESEKLRSRFAAASKNSGAWDPNSSVSVRACTPTETVEHVRTENNKHRAGGTSGDKGFSYTASLGWITVVRIPFKGRNHGGDEY
jgi:hypothetical protein